MIPIDVTTVLCVDDIRSDFVHQFFQRRNDVCQSDGIEFLIGKSQGADFPDAKDFSSFLNVILLPDAVLSVAQLFPFTDDHGCHLVAV